MDRDELRERRDEWRESRHEWRELTFRMLFGAGFHTEDKRASLEHFLDETYEYELDEADREKLISRVMDINLAVPELDRIINAASQYWRTERMGKAELNILRLALYEMKYDKDVPVKVSIDEAVELAKDYGEKEAPAFVNGVLAGLLSEAGEKNEPKPQAGEEQQTEEA